MNGLITEAQAIEITSRLQTFEAWRNGRTSYAKDEVPAIILEVSNEERSALEVYRFVYDVPKTYFAYVNRDGRLTTWMGDTLGTISFGREYRSSFGDTRQSINVKAINGADYYGVYYKSAGDYARLMKRAR